MQDFTSLTQIVALSTLPEQIRAAKAQAGSTAIIAEASASIVKKIGEKLNNPVYDKIDDFEKVDTACCAYNARHASDKNFTPLTIQQYLTLSQGS